MPLSDPSWVWPYWLERQMDPANPEFVPGTADAELVNLTHRDAITLGSLATPERATVDPRGLVTTSAIGWSLDWWIGAEDQWHHPSRAAIVRQHLLGDAPVVETALRVPGGDAWHRAYGFTSTELGPCVAIEIENRTAVPVAVAFAVRPYGVTGFADLHDIDLVDQTVLVDGLPAVVFPKPPADTARARLADGDCAELLAIGDTSPVWRGPVHDPDGWATAAFVFPLTHTAVLRVVLPLAGRPGTGRRGSRGTAGPLPFPPAVPAAEQVAAGWEAQTRRGLLADLPDDRLMRVLEASRAQLLLAHGGSELVHPDTVFDFATAQQVLGALDELGFHDEARQVLAGWSERQALDGTFVVDDEPAARRRGDANGAALGAIGRHWLLARDGALVESLIGPIAKGAHRIDKTRTAKRAERDPFAPDLLPVATGPAYAGPPGAYLRDTAIAVGGLLEVAAACAGIEQPGVAEDARRFAGALDSALERTVGALAEASGGPLPPTASRRLDGGVVANLDLVAPLGILAPDRPEVQATLERIRTHHLLGPAVFRGIGQAGADPLLTARLALAELEAGDIGRPAAGDTDAAPETPLVQRLTWLLERAGETRAWPSTVHPHTGGGSQGHPQDPEANAVFLRLVRRLLVRELRGRLDPADPTTAVPVGLALCSYVPITWLGQPLDVRDAPTELGVVSFSVRWHGERPALLWQLDPHPGVGGVTITAPGLDATWSSTELEGEALLGAIPVPAAVQAEVVPDHDHDHDDDGPGAGAPAAPPPAPAHDPFGSRPPVTPITREGLLGDAPPPAAEPPVDGGSFT